MPVKLETLLPPYFKNIYEIDVLMSVAGEALSQAENAMNRVKKNLYVQTCDAATLEQYERLTGIATAQGVSVDERRRAVINRMNRRLPYTIPKLRDDLDAALGRKGYELYVRHEKYELELDLIDQEYQVLLSMKAMIRETIPAHLLFILAGKCPLRISAESSVVERLSMPSEFYARYNRSSLNLDGSWTLNGSYPLSGYKEAVGLELYPAALAVEGYWHPAPQSGSSLECAGEALVGGGQEAAMGIVAAATAGAGNEAALNMGAGMRAAPRSSCGLRVENDLWHLDGTQALNGEKALDAEIFDYEL